MGMDPAGVIVDSYHHLTHQKAHGHPSGQQATGRFGPRPGDSLLARKSESESAQLTAR
jgi:hypothetical protein